MRSTLAILVVLLLCAVPAWRGAGPEVSVPPVAGVARDGAHVVARDAHAAARDAHGLARDAAPRSDALSCKPRAPIALRLEQVGVRADGAVELLVDVAPVGPSGRVSWELLLPPGAELVEGAVRGDALAGATDGGPHRVVVRLPQGEGFTRVALAAESRLPGDAAPERVHARTALSWGRPPAGAPTRRLLDIARGRVQQVAEVPSAHRSGR